jgi:Rps23 Pro-64 3,4-dihydroxylase Tpa1-like proline 4-hydroxylase
VHLEFLLLQDNRCAIRDSSPKAPMAFGLEAFWKKHYGGELPRFKKPAPSTSAFGSIGGPITPQTTDITANSPYTMPHSLPQQVGI